MSSTARLLFSKSLRTAAPLPRGIAFLSPFQWTDTNQPILNIAHILMIGIFSANGSTTSLPYAFVRLTTSGTEPLAKTGHDNPVQAGTGCPYDKIGLCMVNGEYRGGSMTVLATQTTNNTEPGVV